MTSLVAVVAAGLGAGALHALAFRRLTAGLLTAWGSLLAFVGVSAALRVLAALAVLLALQHWGAGAACAGALGYWLGTKAVVGLAAAERSR
ncbi:MAG TPA: hypothetical protein VEZ44_05340 [bacterium]|nr:hypothetical protein [bacterium]